MTQVTIDADSIAYRIAYAIQNGDNDDRYLKYNVDHMVDEILGNTRCGKYKLYLGGENNFRIKRATLAPYKSNRGEKPVYLEAIRNYMAQRYDAIIVDDMEAEDAAATEHMRYDYNARITLKGELRGSTLSHIDKDLNTVPGKHHNFVKNTFYYITENQAYLNFYKQVLTGDWAVDRIPGLKGIGQARAKKILEYAHDKAYNYPQVLHEIVIDYYQSRLYVNEHKQLGIDLNSGFLGVNSTEAFDAMLEEIMCLLWIRRGNYLEDMLFGAAYANPEEVEKSRQEAYEERESETFTRSDGI